jgi:hypothetical protein
VLMSSGAGSSGGRVGPLREISKARWQDIGVLMEVRKRYPWKHAKRGKPSIEEYGTRESPN